MPRPGSWALLPTTYPNLAGAPVSPTLRPPACQVLCRAMLGTQRIYAGDIKASGAQTWMGRGQTWLGSHHLVWFRSSPERKWPAGVCLLHLCPHQLLSGDKPGSQSRPPAVPWRMGAIPTTHQTGFRLGHTLFPPFQLCRVGHILGAPLAPGLSPLMAPLLHCNGQRVCSAASWVEAWLVCKALVG